MRKNMKHTDEMNDQLGCDMPSSKREIEENLLKELCIREKKSLRIPIDEMSEQMGMTRREMLSHIRQLDREGHIFTDEKKVYVSLTDLGRMRGEECLYRHRTITQFLQYIGVDNERADEDACRMEHVASKETIEQICNFINYGSNFEQIIKHTDLRSRYEPGEYTFLMGIYQMEENYPRSLAEEFSDFSEQMILHVGEENSSFELLYKAFSEESDRELWYKDPLKGWVKAECQGGSPFLPTAIFDYSLRHHDPVVEGTALVAFPREGQEPEEADSRELDVHIW